ncbi:MAG: response regulator [Thiotrichales bacterium]
MQILIVDDSPIMRMIVKKTIKEAGFSGLKIAEASNGEEGLKKVSEVKPALILSDWNMPVMTGIDFLRKLKDGGSNTPFGFVTTEATSEMRQIAKEAGARFIIAKPFTAQSFSDALMPFVH